MNSDTASGLSERTLGLLLVTEQQGFGFHNKRPASRCFTVKDFPLNWSEIRQNMNHRQILQICTSTLLLILQLTVLMALILVICVLLTGFCVLREFPSKIQTCVFYADLHQFNVPASGRFPLYSSSCCPKVLCWFCDSSPLFPTESGGLELVQLWESRKKPFIFLRATEAP